MNEMNNVCLTLFDVEDFEGLDSNSHFFVCFLLPAMKIHGHLFQ
jgi:hypothetical protein